MLSFPRTVDNKPIVEDKNGEKIKDLSVSSLDDIEFIFTDSIICSKDFIMRPDLIAEIKMGNSSKLEILLKANDISNPFSVNEDDVLFIPDPINSERNFKTELVSSNDPREIVRMQYIDISKKDIINTGDSYESYKEREKTNLPPNYAKSGESEYKYENGKIVFGGDVIKAINYNSEIPLEKQEIINKLKG